MVENLFHLRPGYHFLHEAVDASQIFLLLDEIFPAPLSIILDKQEHEKQKSDDDEGQPEIQHHQHDDGSAHHDETLDQQGETVVQRLREGVHIVRETAHQLPVGVGVKIGKGQLLGVFEQIPSDPSHDLLTGDHHELVIAQRGERARAVHERHQKDGPDQARNVAGQNIGIDHRLEHIGAEKVRKAADTDQQAHEQDGPLVNPHVMEQTLHRFCAVLRSGISVVSRHYSPAPSCCE